MTAMRQIGEANEIQNVNRMEAKSRETNFSAYRLEKEGD